MIGVSVAIYAGQMRTDHSLRVVYERNFANAVDAATLRAHINSERLAMAIMLHTSDSEWSVWRQELAARSAASAAILRRLDATLPADPNARAVLAELQTVWTEFNEFRAREVLPRLQGDRIAEARQLFAGVQAERHARIRELARQLADHEAADAQRALQDATARSATNRRIFVGVGGFAFVGAVGLGYAMRRTLGRALGGIRESLARLKHSEQRLNEAQRIARLGSWELDLGTNQLSWSDEIFRIFEIDPSQFAASYEAFLALIHPDDRDSVNRAYSDSVTNHTSYSIVHRLLMRDGRVKFVHERGETLYAPDGRALRTLGTVHDVTEREVTQLALHRSNRVLRMISGCNQALVRAASERELLDAICRIIVDTGGYRFAWTGFAEKSEKKPVRPVAWFGVEAEFLEGAQVAWDDTPRGRGPTGTAIREGVASVCKDTLMELAFAPWRDAAAERGFRSCVALPLRNDAMVFGALSVYAAEPDAFSREDVAWLLELADDLSFGIQALRIRREREVALDSVRRLQQLLTQTEVLSKIGGWQYDVPAGRLTWTEGIYRLCEVDRTTFDPDDTGRVMELYESADRPRIESAFTRALNDAAPYDLEVRMVTASGRKIWVRTVGHVDVADGRVLRVYGNMADITTRVDSEAALQRASAYHRSLIEASLDPLVTIGADGRITDANAATENATGVARTELVGTDFSEYFTDTAKARAGYREAFRAGYVRDYELDLRHRNGRITPVLYNASVYCDSAGNPAGVFAAARDITARRRAEHALRESEELFRYVFTNSVIGKSITKPNGELRVNRAFCDMLGYAEEDLVQRHWREITHPDDMAASEEVVNSLLAGRRDAASFTKRYLRKDGGIVWADVGTSVRRDADGRVLYFMTSMVDVTARQRAEEVSARLVAIVESSDDAIVSKTLDGQIMTWNRGAERLYGYSAEEALGRSIYILVPRDKQAELSQTLRRIANGEHIAHYETTRVRKDGTMVAVSVTLSPIKNTAGQVTGASAIVRDVTERKRVETEIRRLNAELERRVTERTAQLLAANKELEAFAYSVAHDLRAPLRTIDGFSSALLADHGARLGADGCEDLKTVRAASQQMGELIDDVLQLSRTTRAAFQPVRVDLSAVAARIVADLQHTSPERSVEVTIQPELKVTGDATLLRAALENLLSNAWKFTGRRERAKIEFGVTNDNERSTYYVRDNGAGFDMQYVSKLFGAFQRLHSVEEFPGNGIGLATVQRIVHRHGGSVWAEGRENHGATFYFTLPSHPLQS